MPPGHHLPVPSLFSSAGPILGIFVCNAPGHFPPARHSQKERQRNQRKACADRKVHVNKWGQQEILRKDRRAEPRHQGFGMNGESRLGGGRLRAMERQSKSPKSRIDDAIMCDQPPSLSSCLGTLRVSWKGWRDEGAQFPTRQVQQPDEATDIQGSDAPSIPKKAGIRRPAVRSQTGIPRGPATKLDRGDQAGTWHHRTA